jgi:CheY-like chemotaxis protein
MALNICIVDDDPIFITTVDLILSRVIKIDHSLHQFTSPIDALAQFKDRTWLNSCLPLTFLCDINMPGMQGFDLIKALCENYKDEPEVLSKVTIYLLTSSISAADKQMANNDPHIIGFISKPLSPDKLKELLGI